MTPDARPRPARLALVLVPLLALALSACTAEPTPTTPATPTPTVAEIPTPTPTPEPTPTAPECDSWVSEGVLQAYSAENGGVTVRRESAEIDLEELWVWTSDIVPQDIVSCSWAHPDCNCDSGFTLYWALIDSDDADAVLESWGENETDENTGERADVEVSAYRDSTLASSMNTWYTDADGAGESIAVARDGQILIATTREELQETMDRLDIG